MQFSKGPPGIDCIGLSLFLARTLTMLAPGALANVSQVLQAKERVWMRTHESLTHDMIGVLLQPSLPPTNPHQAAGSGAGAFFLKTLPDACIMVSLRDNGLARMEG